VAAGGGGQGTERRIAAPVTVAGDDPERRAVDALRVLAMDGVEAAASGHPGMPMGCAPMAAVLFREVLRHDPARPDWVGRDRFVLSAGHGSMLLYAALHLSGYDRPTLDDLRAFRRLGSPTAGHPEQDLLAGVETTTGPLGQGFATGVGMAIAAEQLAATVAAADPAAAAELLDQRVYAIVSDGDLMEGVAAEAASLAGHLRLGRLVYLYDDNRITIDGTTDLAFSEDVTARFAAQGWHTERVADGTDLAALRTAVLRAQADPRPSLIAVRTTIGHGAPAKAGTPAAHGAPLGADEVAGARAALGWPHAEAFHVPEDVRADWDQRARGAVRSAAWDARWSTFAAAHPDLAADVARRLRGELPVGWETAIPRPSGAKATRQHSGAVLAALAPVLPELAGGSADLAASNNTDLPGERSFSATDRGGRILRFGIREHAMAAAANGMALFGGTIPFVATFLVFSDYLRPALRLAALMHRRVVYVLTHDSIGLGEDGPTHQPVEHLAALRAIPGVEVVRPADGAETALAWRSALTRSGPTVLALTRQAVPDLGELAGRPVPDDAVERGAWVVRDAPGGAARVVLVGTGSEVGPCVAAADLLAADGIAARVVSMPSRERFLAQDHAVRDAVLPSGVAARVVVEAGVGQGWEGIAGPRGELVVMRTFGASAPAGDLFAHFGFSPTAIADAARRSLARAARDLLD
jgi:transketolase